MNKPKKGFDLDLLDEAGSVASQTECTGLIQIPPENEWEQDSYEDIYDVPRKKNNKKSGL